MKKLLFTFLVVFTTILSNSQNIVLIDRNDKHYSVYFPNGFITTSYSIQWTGHAVATELTSEEFDCIMADYNMEDCGGPVSKICSEAKAQASNASKPAGARCGPNRGANSSNQEYMCLDQNNSTCSFHCLDARGGVYWEFWPIAAEPILDMYNNEIQLDIEFIAAAQ